MVSSRFLLQLSPFLAIAHAFPRRSTGIQWAPCNETELPSLFPMECGNLLVPLDYSDPDCNDTLQLDLARVPATKQPSKGSILTNFGGPGQEGRSSLASLGALLSGLSDGEYDIVTFDPRGTANTLPFRCYDDDSVSISAVEDLGSAQSSDTAPGTLWATTTLYANDCYEYAKETGGLIGTAFVARDLMQVVDALDEDGMLRLWGISYGTTLGATVAAMFPDRIDKMILDAVQNPHEYYHALADFEEWTQSDDVFLGIFSTCLEAPENCALARPDVTAEELKQSVLDFIQNIKYHPIPLNNHLLDFNGLKGFIAAAIYGPDSWPSTAALLDKLLRNDLSDETIAALDEAVATTPEAMAESYGYVGIHCSDRDVRASSLEEFMPTFDKLHNTSVLMGGLSDGINALCAQWKLPAKEIYQGDFQVSGTKNPVLFIANTYDGHTPIASAFNVSSGFEDSVVLEVNGYGHSSTKNPSKCVYERISAYWRDGTLPEEGEVCQIDSKPYGNVTWADILPSADSGNKARTFKPGRFY